MRKVINIKFGIPVSKVLKNFQDLSFYHVGDKNLEYVEIFYDGNDFLIVNNHLTATQTKPRKTYVAKTNVAQWELDDADGTKSDAGVSKTVRTKANP